MLFMDIYTWEPGQRDELIKRRMEKKGNALKDGVKKIDEWFDVGGGRGFLLIESDDPQAAIQSTLEWSDLMKMEIVPLVEVSAVFPDEKGKGSKK
jgi:hypothetical protein